MWRRSPAVVSKDGRSARVDFMLVAELAEHYRIMGVKPAAPRMK